MAFILSASVLVDLTDAVHADAARHPSALRAALQRLVNEGRETDAPAELLVAALKTASAGSNGIGKDERAARYGAALVQLLALYFDEDAD